MEQFVDRDVELDQLTDCYESETADFVVIYGRRRLGKSELVRQSIADRDDAVYYQAVESTAQNQLEQFVDTATAQFPSLRNVRRAEDRGSNPLPSISFYRRLAFSSRESGCDSQCFRPSRFTRLDEPDAVLRLSVLSRQAK